MPQAKQENPLVELEEKTRQEHQGEAQEVGQKAVRKVEEKENDEYEKEGEKITSR